MDVSLRDVTIAQMGNGDTAFEWRHAQEACGGFWEIWKVSWVELKTRHQTRRVDFRGSQRPDEFACYGCRTRCVDRWKSQNRKNVYLSPYVEKHLHSKVIKSFVPELRSRKCFSCFEIPMFYVYIYEHYIYVSHIRILLWYSMGIT